jgi:hypothetical protein
MGVMSAPPPIPVSPTVNPTMTEASAMDQSTCILQVLPIPAAAAMWVLKGA